MKISRRAPVRRMSSITSSTGFCNWRRPQAVGTTQKSHACAQPRVASKTSVVM